MKKVIKRLKVAGHIIILLLFTLVILASSYVKIFFGNETVDEFIFYLTNGVSNGDMGIYQVAVEMCLPFFIIIFLLVISLFYNVLIDKEIRVKIKSKSFKIYPIEFTRRHKIIFTTIFCVGSLFIAILNLDLINYYKNVMAESSFIEDNYVMDLKSISFDGEKRNLIYIIVESLETTFFTEEQGGEWNHEVMPELYNLLNEDGSIYFSATDKAGGMSVQSGATWTTAAIVSNSTGLPFKIPINGNSYHSDNFMNGSYAIGDLLKDNGYYNEVISGARTNFGGLKEFYTKHGDYAIVDINSLDDYDYNYEKEDKGPWGLNDNYIFKIARDRLLKISKKEQPFNMTLITIDPHPNDGYIGYYSVDDYDDRYENVYATESKLVYDFISWVKQQDFYENTTIVIVGDHLNMQTEYFKGRNDERYIYNVIINSAVTTENTKYRTFTPVDMYPTTVAAIGGTIKGNQLGLGVNLFSERKTLAEEYGLSEFNSNLDKRSPFYNTYILGSDYFEMVARH